jgi:hypothetical protein
MQPIKLDRTKTAFVTEEGIIAFCNVFAGQAKAPQDQNRQPNLLAPSRYYKAEHAVSEAGKSLTDAVSYVAQMNDKNWERHVFGPLGRLKKLEGMPGRDPKNYGYAEGKFIYGCTSTLTLDSKGIDMSGANLADIAVRAQFDAKVAAMAPKVVRYADVSSPSDLAQIEAMNQDRRFRNLAPIAEPDYYKVQLPVMSHELKPGDIVRLAGSAYWNKHKKSVSLGLDMVLWVRAGDPLVMTASPDATFGAFAPPSALAPPAPHVRAEDPWASVV